DENRKLFSNQYLKHLILPLFIEQLLVMMVGIADTLMVSYAGEAAVSGVSLVNMFYMIFVYIFSALASGGAVVVSHYIGSKDKEHASLAASQMITIATLVSAISMFFILIFNRQILHLMFGRVEASVMEASVIYLRISAYSFLALAIYNVGAALFRSMGKTKTTMYISLGMNVINVIGNAIGIFVLKAGVAGVAWPSFLSRVFAAVVIIVLCFSKTNAITLKISYIFSWNKTMLRRILGIAVPNSIESGLFQLAKVALSAITALFGTSQIAANGVAQSFWSLAALIGVAMGPAYITVIGQCMGGKDVEAAQYYMIKLLKITFISSILWNGVILITTPFVLNLYDLSNDTKRLVFILVLIHNIFNSVAFPISSPFSSGLRAAGDVKYTMYVSVFTTVICRVLLSVIFGIWLNLGVIGIALAMAGDWCIRAFLMYYRYKSNNWKTFKLI
ncbi:MAG: MATE family efflux transporter, partial [Mobilitalea sp.]